MIASFDWLSSKIGCAIFALRIRALQDSVARGASMPNGHYEGRRTHARHSEPTARSPAQDRRSVHSRGDDPGLQGRLHCSICRRFGHTLKWSFFVGGIFGSTQPFSSMNCTPGNSLLMAPSSSISSSGSNRICASRSLFFTYSPNSTSYPSISWHPVHY